MMTASSGYAKRDDAAYLARRTAPTGEDGVWTLPRPRPLFNDQNTALLGGVAGHAGFFTSTGDLQKMVRMLMNGGQIDGTNATSKPRQSSAS
jgi:CubicO group peptidase (beta-lactamase class C family)